MDGGRLHTLMVGLPLHCSCVTWLMAELHTSVVGLHLQQSHKWLILFDK